MTPADIRRVRPEEDADLVAIEQVRGLLHRLPEQSFSPLFVFDAGYDPVRLQLGLENHPAQILVRLHSDRVFYFDPEDPEKSRSDVRSGTAKGSISRTPKPGPNPPQSTTARPGTTAP